MTAFHACCFSVQGVQSGHEASKAQVLMTSFLWPQWKFSLWDIHRVTGQDRATLTVIFFFFTPLSLSLFLSLVPFHLHLPPLLSPLSSIYVIVIDLDSIEICHTVEERLSIIWEDSIQVVTSSLSLKGHLSPFFEGVAKEQMNFLMMYLSSL